MGIYTQSMQLYPFYYGIFPYSGYSLLGIQVDLLMKKIILFIILIVFIFYLGFKVKWSKLFSHGVLSEAHEEMEKSGECNACHTKGQKLDFDKCLVCHNEIKEKI